MEDQKTLTRKDWMQTDDEPSIPKTYDSDLPEEQEKAQKPVYNHLTQIVPLNGANAMASRGFAHIKRVVVGVDGKENIEIIVIPITAARIDMTQKKFSDERRPQPPMKSKVVFPDSELGKDLGLTEKKICEVAVLDDPKYVKALEEFNEKLAWSLVAEAVDIPLMIHDSKSDQLVPAKTTGEKIQALKQAGFTEAQVLEISRTVGRVSHWTEEERRRFFGES